MPNLFFELYLDYLWSLSLLWGWRTGESIGKATHSAGEDAWLVDNGMIMS